MSVCGQIKAFAGLLIWGTVTMREEIIFYYPLFLWHRSLMRPGGTAPNTVSGEASEVAQSPGETMGMYQILPRAQSSRPRWPSFHWQGQAGHVLRRLVAQGKRGQPSQGFRVAINANCSPAPLVSGQAAGGEWAAPSGLHRLDGDSTLNLRPGEGRWPDLSTTAAGYPAGVAPSFLAR